MIGRISTLLRQLERASLSFGIIGIALVTILNVIWRTSGGEGLASAEELAQVLVIFVTFSGVSYAARTGRHIRMSALYDSLPLKWRRLAMIVISLSTACVLILLSYWTLRYIEVVHRLGAVTPALRVPVWAVYVVAPIGLLLAAIQYLLTAIKNMTTGTGNEVWLSVEVKDSSHASGDAIPAAPKAPPVEAESR